MLHLTSKTTIASHLVWYCVPSDICSTRHYLVYRCGHHFSVKFLLKKCDLFITPMIANQVALIEQP